MFPSGLRGQRPVWIIPTVDEEAHRGPPAPHDKSWARRPGQGLPFLRKWKEPCAAACAPSDPRIRSITHHEHLQICPLGWVLNEAGGFHEVGQQDGAWGDKTGQLLGGHGDLLSLCCLVPRGKGSSDALWYKGRMPRGGKGRGLRPGQEGKGAKVGKPPAAANSDAQQQLQLCFQ